MKLGVGGHESTILAQEVRILNHGRGNTHTCVGWGQPPLSAHVIPSLQVSPTIERRLLKIPPNGDPSRTFIPWPGEEMQSALSEREVFDHIGKQ